MWLGPALIQASISWQVSLRPSISVSVFSCRCKALILETLRETEGFQSQARKTHVVLSTQQSQQGG